MKILILGGDGMLGHQLLESLHQRHEVFVTLHNDSKKYETQNIFNVDNSLYDVEASNFDQIEKIFNDLEPSIVINCIGIVKQRKDAEDAIKSIKINSLLPHQLAKMCTNQNARLVQISTDCVFSGKKGNYQESDIPDAVDLYGRTKLLGEVALENHLTLRTSIIGLELSRKHGLIEWFLAQKGIIRGRSNAIFSGFITPELASIIESLITQYSSLTGLWHVASNPISKYQLLCNLAEKLDRQDVEIIEEKNFQCDRSLNSTKFNSATGYISPSWNKMLDTLAEQIIKRKQ